MDFKWFDNKRNVCNLLNPSDVETGRGLTSLPDRRESDIFQKKIGACQKPTMYFKCCMASQTQMTGLGSPFLFFTLKNYHSSEPLVLIAQECLYDKKH